MRRGEARHTARAYTSPFSAYHREARHQKGGLERCRANHALDTPETPKPGINESPRETERQKVGCDLASGLFTTGAGARFLLFQANPLESDSAPFHRTLLPFTGLYCDVSFQGECLDTRRPVA